MVPRNRLHLANLPTPLEPWLLPNYPTTYRFWIQRDDMTGSTLSGNKIRKLEFLLADAIAQNCDTVITCGSIQSNHARATAVATAQLGIQSHLFLRTPDTSQEPGLEGNLLLDRLTGTTLYFITPDEYTKREKLMQQKAVELKTEGKRPYIIPEGGSNALGSWGYIEAVRELIETHKIDTLGITDIVVALGSGGTAAGLAAGLQLLNNPIRVHAVNVCDDATHFHSQIQHIFDDLGISAQSKDRIDIMDGHMGSGYAQATQDELRSLIDIARSTGIVLDPVYTGKAFHGLAHEIMQHPNRFQGSRILFIHTGGLFGLFPYRELLPI